MHFTTMEVKIYREPENQALILDENQVKEYNKLAQAIGVIPISEDVSKIPGIYVPLNTAMQKQLQALCPTATDVKTYNFSTIPVEVLKVLQLCIENKMYEGYQVWYNEVAPDPLLIGWNFKSDEDRLKNYGWAKNRFLIARWGAESLELEELLELGFCHIKQQLIDKAKIAMDQAEGILKNVDTYAKQIVEGQPLSKVYFDTTADRTIY